MNIDYERIVSVTKTQEEQLRYQRDWRTLRRMFVKMWRLARPVASYEVRFTFSDWGVPGQIEIIEIE